jgi:hypothetical protein
VVGVPRPVDHVFVVKIMFVAIGRVDRQARFDDAALLLGED